MQIPLAIRYSRNRQRETVAWLVPGNGPATWLDELTKWGVPLRALILRPVPTSKGDPSPQAVLVTGSSENPPRVSCRCQQYGRMAKRLFLPANAVLDPDVLDSEVDPLITGNDDEFVYHPSVGLICIESTERLRVADLLDSPEMWVTDWNVAQPGYAICRRLLSVEPEHCPTVDTILMAGKDDIATENPISREAPQSRTERRGSDQSQGGRSKENRGGGLTGRFLDTLRSVFRRTPSQKSREAELDRLTRLLDQDPDEGLRYALPLDGPAHRGLSPPSSRLTQQTTDFDLHRLSRTGPADPWHVSWDRYQHLQRRYRELANREIALGRHRRAAYIFAHLLNDLFAAAGALATGHHWREAAIVYRDQLKRPNIAAEYFEKGGFWAEAIEAYDTSGDFEKLGDLHRVIDQEAEADAAYRRAVQVSVERGDWLSAARLLEQKLTAPDEAVAHLAKGWPNSDQAIGCLRETFRIYGTADRHEDATQLIGQLDPHLLQPDAAIKAVEVLSGVANRYPQSEVCELAGDRARAMAGHVLPTASKPNVDRILTRIEELTPSDRLLKRDCRRFRGLCQKGRKGKTRPVRRHRRPPERLLSGNLPSGVDWIAAAYSEHAAYFAGFQEESFTIARWPWHASREEMDLVQWQLSTASDDTDGFRSGKEVDSVQWQVSPGFNHAPALLCPDPAGTSGVLAHLVGMPQLLHPMHYPATDEFPDGDRIGSHRAFSSQSRGAARSLDRLTWLLEHEGNELILTTYGPADQMMSSQAIPLPPEMPQPDLDAVEPIPVAASHTHVFMGLREGLYCLKRGLGVEFVPTNSPVRGLTIPPGPFPYRVLLQCENELAVFWHGPMESRLEIIDDTAVGSVSGFARDGRIVKLDGKSLDLYTMAQHHHQFNASIPYGVNSALAVLPATTPDQILVCSRRGELHLLRLP